ncbi:MAG: flagellar export chaperone FliS [Deltaproteobacteria bacterium]|nr:MAG: flagellar export chaperone FliS [Deltaproteobacteria bacterium]
MNAYTKQYQQNQVATASPEQILLMLYDGAIRFVRRAITAAENNDTVDKLQGISKCLAIIAEFSNSLNHEIGAHFAEDLDGLYHFMMRELDAARKDSGTNHLKTVENLLMDLKQTWEEAVAIHRKEQVAALSKQHHHGDRGNFATPPQGRLVAAG